MAILNGSWNLNVIISVIGIVTIIFLLVRRRYSYWERKGFKSMPNVNYLFGHLGQTFLQKETLGETIERIYHSTDEPFIGIYGVLRPILLIRDPELIQKILITDFSHFTDRGVHNNEKYDPLSTNLFGLCGHRWRDMRTKLSPAFTSSKVKAMFSTFKDCGSILQRFLKKFAYTDKLLDVCELSTCHFTNVIASVAFGIEVDTINNPNDDFRECGRQAFDMSIGNAFRLLMYFVAPELMSVLRVKCCKTAVGNFMVSVVKQNLEYREKFSIFRKDFFQLLIQLRNTGNIQNDGKWETKIKTNENQKMMSLHEIAAQVGIFYATAIATSSSTISFAMYELTKNLDIQQRVHDEIDRVLENHNGQLTYECISDMKYLDACIDETLRKYSYMPMLTRTCVKDYRIPGTDKILKKGTWIIIPNLALQRDEKYYENPDKFDPNRFSKENLVGVNQINRPYYAFGDGPRNCIGGNMGTMQTKIALVMMLQKFRFECENKLQNRKLKFDPRALFQVPLGGIQLRVFNRCFKTTRDQNPTEKTSLK